MTTATRTPIAKLYKRCARKHHDRCPGSFEDWSICSCPCHAGKAAETPTVAQEAAQAVETAEQWIAAHPEIAAANEASKRDVEEKPAEFWECKNLGAHGDPARVLEADKVRAQSTRSPKSWTYSNGMHGYSADYKIPEQRNPLGGLKITGIPAGPKDGYGYGQTITIRRASEALAA